MGIMCGYTYYLPNLYRNHRGKIQKYYGKIMEFEFGTFIYRYLYMDSISDIRIV